MSRKCLLKRVWRVVLFGRVTSLMTFVGWFSEWFEIWLDLLTNTTTMDTHPVQGLVWEMCELDSDVKVSLGEVVLVSMEPTKKRKFSPVWEHFDLISPNKVKCLLCAKELGYNDNTSSMLRHFRAFHDETFGGGASHVTRKEELDEALVNMIVKGTRPFSIVEDEGFREFVAKLDPTYVLPTRKLVKAMVEAKYVDEKEKAKAELRKIAAVSLTTDMWTSINTDTFLAVTCHFIDADTNLKSVLLGVAKFPQSHTAEELACVKTSLMEEWGIASKITCLVTDGTPNMIACGKELRLRHAVCIAHTLNVVVKKALDMTPMLSLIRAKARKLVGYFRSSTTAKEKLALAQDQTRRTNLKLLQEVETRWNSTFQMLQRLVELREPVGTTLASLEMDIASLTPEEYNIVTGCLSVLSPFYKAAVELSEEKRVSASKVIPLLKTVEHVLQEKVSVSTVPVATELGEHLSRLLREKLDNIQSMSVMLLATLLDPRYKSVGFFSPATSNDAVERLTSECADVISRSTCSRRSPAEASTSQDAANESAGDELWSHFDAMVEEARRSHNVTADATIEVQRYLSERNIRRLEDPLQYWERQRSVYPNLYRLAVGYLCTPASSVPCQRVFSEAGDVVCKKRSPLNRSTVEQILFLNKDE